MAPALLGFKRGGQIEQAGLGAHGGHELERQRQTERLTQAVVARGHTISATTLWDTLNQSVLVSHALWQLFDSVDVLLLPMLSGPPPLLGHFPMDHDDVDAHFERMTTLAPLATLANVAGLPALTLPYGSDALGLPLPLQLMAPMGAETRLLDLAATLEAEQRWSHRYPIAGLP